MQLLELKATITSSPTKQPSNHVLPTPQLVSPLVAVPPDPDPPSLSDSIATLDEFMADIPAPNHLNSQVPTNQHQALTL